MRNIEQFFENSILHDCEIDNIEINYVGGTIVYKVIRPNKEKLSCIIKKFISLDIIHKEEWGKGKYIVSSDVKFEKNIYFIEIQLNSGDICSISCYS